MQFTLTIELDGMAKPAIQLAELLSMLHNELREDGITPGVHDVMTRKYWRHSADGESSELVANIVGKWEVTGTPEAMSALTETRNQRAKG